MTLKNKPHTSKAFFDYPSSSPTGRNFLIRRLVSIASKSILSFRNQPTQPSHGSFSSKCFTNSPLFRFTPPIERLKKFRPVVKEQKLEKIDDFQTPPSLVLERPEVKAKSTHLPVFAYLKVKKGPKPVFLLDITTKERGPRLRPHRNESAGFLLPNLDLAFACPGYHCVILTFATNQICSLATNFSFPGITNGRAPIFTVPEISSFSTMDFSFPSFLCSSLNIPSNKLTLACEQLNSTFSSDYQSTLIPEANRPSFSQSPRFDGPYQFDFRPEIGKNLILEAKTVLVPEIGKKQPQAVKTSRSIIFPRIEKQNKFSAVNLPGFKIGNFVEPWKVINSKKKIETAHEFCQISLTSFNLQKNTGLFPTHMLPIDQPMDKTLRLKLKLTRVPFKYNDFAMKTWSHFLLSPHLPKAQKMPISDSFARSLKKTFRAVSGYKILELKKLFKTQPFCRKSGKMFFSTRTHAKYSAAKVKRIILPKLPAPSMVTPIIKQQLRGRIGNSFHNHHKSFSHNPGLFQDFIGILGRPTAFLMSLTQMNFTDIELPFTRRRLKTPKGFFKGMGFGGNDQKRLLPMRNYKFPAAIKTPISFLQSKEKKSPISLAKENFKCVNAHFTPIVCKETYLYVSQKPSNPIFKEYFSKFTLTGIKDGLPEVVCDEFKLVLGIVKPQPVAKISQTNIIAPPEWLKRTRNFNCRIRLLPYPFGFPQFSSPEFNMGMLLRKPANSIFQEVNQPIDIPFYYFSPSKRVYRSKYNLKSPEKWLFAEPFSDKTNFQKLNFKTYYSSPANSFVYPEKPINYEFSWLSRAGKKSFGVTFCDGYKLNDVIRIQQQSKFQTPDYYGDCKYLTAQEEELSIAGKLINRLLLEKINLKCETRKGKTDNFKQIPLTGKVLMVVKDALDKSAIEDFTDRLAVHNASYKNILAFYHTFKPISRGGIQTQSQWKARFREFFFPYSPEFHNLSNHSEIFFEVDDTTQVQKFDSSQELRTTQILLSGFDNANMRDFYRGNLTSSESPTNRSPSFPIFTRVPEAKAYKIRKLVNYKRRIPRGLLKISSRFKPDFGKMFLLEKPDSSKNWTAKTPRFDFSGLDIPKKELIRSLRRPIDFGNFSMDSVHWVIMLSNFMKVSLKKLNIFLNPEFHAKTFKPTPLNSTPKSISLQEKVFPTNLWFFAPSKPLFFAKTASDCECEQITISQATTGKISQTLTISPVVNFKFPESKTGFVDRDPKIVSRKARIDLTTKPSSRMDFAAPLVDYRMHGKVSPPPKKGRLKSGILRPTRSEFRHPYTPEWFDMAMDNIHNSVDIKARGTSNLKFFSGTQQN